VKACASRAPPEVPKKPKGEPSPPEKVEPMTAKQRAVELCDKIRKQGSACRWFAIHLELHQMREMVQKVNAHAAWLEAMYRVLNKLVSRNVEDEAAYEGYFAQVEKKFQWYSTIEKTLKQMERDTLTPGGGKHAGKKGKGKGSAAASGSASAA
jgi:hypothetical protein